MPTLFRKLVLSCSVHGLPYVLKQVAEKIAWPEFNKTFLPINWNSVPIHWPPLSDSACSSRNEANTNRAWFRSTGSNGWRTWMTWTILDDCKQIRNIRNQVTQRLHSKDLVDGPRSPVQELSGRMLPPLAADLNIYEPWLTNIGNVYIWCCLTSMSMSIWTLILDTSIYQ
jgi:hypothetical protein